MFSLGNRLVDLLFTRSQPILLFFPFPPFLLSERLSHLAALGHEVLVHHYDRARIALLLC